MLLALCGALVHYFNSVAPRNHQQRPRLKEAANALMAHVLIKTSVKIDANAAGSPLCRRPTPSNMHCANTQGRLLGGNAQLPAVVMTTRPVSSLPCRRSITGACARSRPRFDTRAALIFIPWRTRARRRSGPRFAS